VNATKEAFDPVEMTTYATPVLWPRGVIPALKIATGGHSRQPSRLPAVRWMSDKGFAAGVQPP
jgi:hypothetical protein